MRLGWFRIGLVSSMVLAPAGCGGDADGGSGSGSGTGSSADSGSSASTISEETSGSASLSGSGSGSGVEETSAEVGGGDCCGIVDCADGVGVGDSCVEVPCCANGTPLLCGMLQCGSQSCVGTLAPSSCDDCELLQQNLNGLFQQASLCDPAADTCIVSDALTDVCGCNVSVNGDAPVLEALQLAYDVWVAQGCGPVGCGAPCAVGEATCVAGDAPYCGFGP